MNESTFRPVRVALVLLLTFGALAVLAPFLPALGLAVVIVLASWPLFARLEVHLGGRSSLAALLMTLLLATALLLPMAYLAATAADGVSWLIEFLRGWIAAGDYSPPHWLADLPLVGTWLSNYWTKIFGSQEELARLAQQLFEPTRRFLTAAASLIGQGLLELTLVVFVTFFFYRDGRTLAQRVDRFAQRLGGELGGRMLEMARTTIIGVLTGIVGTAFGQAMAALVGFLIAGVPAPLLLAAATFFLSMVPIGPPLVWGGAAWWLYREGEPGWAIFMVVWGAAVISSVDNFLKPILISKSASLPILLVALGVFGGVLAFGFVGIFLGPVILALARMLIEAWLTPGAEQARSSDSSASPSP
ncbi:MAG: AI-2E family transporter [Rhodocyclaceae bacterium]|nr:AI-2E family transporter [Rhodocyclaceae bacterium]